MSSFVPVANKRSNTGIMTGKLAVWWVIGSEIVIFGGLLMAYLMLRFKFEHWGAAAAKTNTMAGTINTFILLTSSLMVVLAHHYAAKKDGLKAALYLWATIFGGFCFLIVKGLEWAPKIAHGITVTTNSFWSYYYLAASIHGLHVIGGMVIMGFISVDCLRNKNLHRVENIGLYWHFVDIVWIFLFPLLYIAK